MNGNNAVCYQSGDGIHYPYSVDINLSYSSNKKSNLYLCFIELWLQSKCDNGWNLEAFGELSYKSLTDIKIYFQNPKDCIFFKLSPVKYETTNIVEYFM